MTSEEREKIEARLTDRLAELVHTRVAMKRSAEGSRGGELADVDQHLADSAGELYDEEMEETERIFFEEEERRIAEARQALADGSYGICRYCGKPIPAGRLAAVPEAVRCLDCQRHFEGHQRQRTSIS